MQFEHPYTHFSFLALLPSLPYPMPCVVVLSCTLVSSLWNAKNWLYPAVERLEAPVLIIAPMNFVDVAGRSWRMAFHAQPKMSEALCEMGSIRPTIYKRQGRKWPHLRRLDVLLALLRKTLRPI